SGAAGRNQRSDRSELLHSRQSQQSSYDRPTHRDRAPQPVHSRLPTRRFPTRWQMEKDQGQAGPSTQTPDTSGTSQNGVLWPAVLKMYGHKLMCGEWAGTGASPALPQHPNILGDRIDLILSQPIPKGRHVVLAG